MLGHGPICERCIDIEPLIASGNLLIPLPGKAQVFNFSNNKFQHILLNKNSIDLFRYGYSVSWT